MSIETLRQGEYPGSDIVIEQTLDSGSNYQRYIASYKSEGLKIYGLLTIPNGAPSMDSTSQPQAGSGPWPAIIFNHGYISPSVYRTTEKYVAYQDAFARAGYVTFKSDYRGHGNSEGNASGGYGSNDYTIDILNAVSSIQELKDPSNVMSQKSIVNPVRIGVWGHSMGGHITLESMVVNPDIKVGVIWAGVVGSYEDLFERWRRRSGPTPTPNPNSQRRNWRQQLAELYGEPSQNPEFWASLSATSYLEDISGPIQLHHGTADVSVPLAFSVNLDRLLKDKGRKVELYTYEGDDHNLSNNLSLALSRSVEFFDKYLK
ncbi:peptidase [Candidatus Woesebacteria bacterium RBG_16_39_8b]|uniref:Peptidase n=1 Tax=Candidatus Woesebacteria bacterium RBG_16_39_8b TaxID=1802482 RepID=A0A1F7XE40_9BACT|nr:MAG: peptidase [Candidatus Woesebacteria bacterium RBG_16_39_8b]